MVYLKTNTPAVNGKSIRIQNVAVPVESGASVGQKTILLKNSVAIPLQDFPEDILPQSGDKCLFIRDKNLCIPIMLSSAEDLIPENGLVFYAPLSKDINTTTGHTLIDNGGVAFGSIDGIDASLFIGSKNLSFTQSNFPKNKESFTFSGWFYLLSNPSGERMIMSWGGDGARTYFIPFINGNKFQCSSHVGDWFVNAYTFDYNKWYHVLITHETPNMKVYVNSNFVNTYNVSYSIGSGTTAMIGNYLPDPSRNFNGYICGLRVYNRVLTQEEIVSLSKEFVPYSNL